jgi:hypothetical protein
LSVCSRAFLLSPSAAAVSLSLSLLLAARTHRRVSKFVKSERAKERREQASKQEEEATAVRSFLILISLRNENQICTSGKAQKCVCIQYYRNKQKCSPTISMRPPLDATPKQLFHFLRSSFHERELLWAVEKIMRDKRAEEDFLLFSVCLSYWTLVSINYLHRASLFNSSSSYFCCCCCVSLRYHKFYF